jgi:hypothetical protein
MANAWKEVAWIASEAINHTEDALNIAALCAKDKTADFNVKPNGYAVGSTVDIRTNPVYKAEEFTSAIVIQDIRSSSRQMSIEKHFDVSAKLTAKEKRMDFEDFSTQVIRPAAYAIAEKVEDYLATKILHAAGMYVSSDLFGSSADMALAKKAATFQQLSPTGRFCLVNDTLEAKLLGAAYFNTYTNRGDKGAQVFTTGSMGYAMGMNFFSSLHLPTEANLAGTGVGVTNNTGGTTNKLGMTALTTTATTGTFKVGDRVQVAGARRPMRVLTQVTVGGLSIPLVDPIQEIIPDAAAITVIGSGATNTFMGAIFDDSSLAIASPMLDPASDKPSFSVSNNGVSIRVVQGYDMTAKTETISLDMLCGAAAYDQRRITALYDN